MVNCASFMLEFNGFDNLPQPFASRRVNVLWNKRDFVTAQNQKIVWTHHHIILTRSCFRGKRELQTQQHGFPYAENTATKGLGSLKCFSSAARRGNCVRQFPINILANDRGKIQRCVDAV